MEVSLNHMFNVFFRIVPSKFINTLLDEACNIDTSPVIRTDVQEDFEAKIKRFGWDEPIEQDNVIKEQVTPISQSELSLENKTLLGFLDKHFDLFKIDSELYALNLNQLKDEQHVSMNHRLRAVLERKGLYDFEIDSFIVNGSDATRIHMADDVRSVRM